MQVYISHGNKTVPYDCSTSLNLFAQEQFGVGKDAQRFTYKNQILSVDDGWLSNVVSPALVTLTSVLLGGKGGFGALIRNQVGIKKKKITNFDACRDLNGRRLRHSKALERLKKWADENEQDDALVSELEVQERECWYVITFFFRG